MVLVIRVTPGGRGNAPGGDELGRRSRPGLADVTGGWEARGWCLAAQAGHTAPAADDTDPGALTCLVTGPGTIPPAGTVTPAPGW